MNRILRYINNTSNSETVTNEKSIDEESDDSEYFSEEEYSDEISVEESNLLNIYKNVSYEGSGENYELDYSWEIWYHHIKNNWKVDGFNNIFTITNIKEFWDFNNNTNILGGINSHHFFMMRTGINPIWEDEQNKYGGCWSIKIPTEKSLELWTKLSTYIVGGHITSDKDIINGISICAKNPVTSVVKIWNNNNKLNSIELLPVDILNEYGFNIIYKSHIPEY